MWLVLAVLNYGDQASLEFRNLPLTLKYWDYAQSFLYFLCFLKEGLSCSDMLGIIL